MKDITTEKLKTIFTVINKFDFDITFTHIQLNDSVRNMWLTITANKLLCHDKENFRENVIQGSVRYITREEIRDILLNNGITGEIASFASSIQDYLDKYEQNIIYFKKYKNK